MHEQDRWFGFDEKIQSRQPTRVEYRNEPYTNSLLLNHSLSIATAQIPFKD